MAIRKPVIDRPFTVSDVATGGVMPSDGNSASYETGSWRTERPIFYPERCTNCLICWISCPDSSILVEDGKVVGIDTAHCKGCGICSVECPTKPDRHAILMEVGGVYAEKEVNGRRTL